MDEGEDQAEGAEGVDPVGPLRVVDFGLASALRSQTLWHAVAHGVSDGAPSTLSFVRPRDPYVCIGFHRRLSEVDTAHCERAGWPVYRRMVGGGPVYLDSGQLFFQITARARDLPPARPRALRLLLEPAAAAFRAVGVDAHLDDRLEIVVGDRKICGYGAGQIGDAVIVVGNLIETFDHAAATSVVACPSPSAREMYQRLMTRYVTATPADAEWFKTEAIAAYADALGLDPTPGFLTPAERAHRDELDTRFCDPEWIAGTDLGHQAGSHAPRAWQVKVRAGVFVFAGEVEGTSLTVGVDGDRVIESVVCDPNLNGQATTVAESLVGLDLDDVIPALQAAEPAADRLVGLAELINPKKL